MFAHPLKLTVQLREAGVLPLEDWLLLVVNAGHDVGTGFIEAVCRVVVINSQQARGPHFVPLRHSEQTQY